MNKTNILLGILIVMLALLWVVMMLATANCEEGFYVLCMPESNVNVRSKPKMNASVVGWVQFGSYVITDGKEKGGFIHVVDLAAETTEGWIYAGYLVDEEPRKEKYKAEVWGGSVIVRDSVSGKRIGKLRDGQTVTVYAQTNRWCVTNRGYVMADWLRGVE